MAGTAVGQRRGSGSPLAGLRRYIDRRSALELVVLDIMVVAAALMVALPRALALDASWVRTLLALSPGLLLVGRSLVLAVHAPGVFRLAQLDPGREIAAGPLLDEARNCAAVGLVLLTLTLGACTAIAGAVAVA